MTVNVTKGTVSSLSVRYNAAANRRTTDSADANGNIQSGVTNYDDGYDDNFRQNSIVNSLQINTNSTTGQIQLDIDTYGPAWGAGYILHGIFQVVPHIITGSDTNYGDVGHEEGMVAQCP